MENNSNRRLLIIVGFVLFFAVIVLVWYFFYAKPVVAPSLSNTNNPLGTKETPARSAFLTWGNDEKQVSSVEVSDPLKEPLVEVWEKPATGQTFITQSILQEVTSTTTQGTSTIEVTKTVRATSTGLMFVDKTTGYIYSYAIESGKTMQISNTVLPGVYDAYFFDNGNRVIIRYIDRNKNTVVGLIAKVPNVSEKGQASSLEAVEYLTSQVVSVAVNNKKDKVAYLVTTDAGSAVYTVTPGKRPSLLTTSPFGEWTLSYGGDKLYATTKPSAYVSGVTVSLPSFNSEVGERTGLITIPGERDLLLNSMWGSQGLVTFISENGNLKVLQDKTLAKKCAWGEKLFLICAVPKSLPRSEEGLPDDWFQGRVLFDDTLVVIDSQTGGSYPIFTFPEKLGTFDVLNITEGKGDTLFSFNRKQNGSLWLLNTTLLEGE
jgi:hypothetical protein